MLTGRFHVILINFYIPKHISLSIFGNFNPDKTHVFFLYIYSSISTFKHLSTPIISYPTLRPQVRWDISTMFAPKKKKQSKNNPTLGWCQSLRKKPTTHRNHKTPASQRPASPCSSPAFLPSLADDVQHQGDWGQWRHFHGQVAIENDCFVYKYIYIYIWGFQKSWYPQCPNHPF